MRSDLKFIWGVSLALGLAVLVCVVLVYRAWSMHTSHQRELLYRQDIARILRDAIATHLPPERAVTAMNALRALGHSDQ